MRLKGIDVTLYDRHIVGLDPFNKPIYEPIEITVHNVLIAPSAISSSPEELNINGKIAEYTLAIPKGDTNHWEDRVVEFFGEKWQTIGPIEQGIEALVPTSWHKKIKVARYE